MNVQRVLYQTAGAKKLDGVAVVSAIIAAEDPKEAALELKRLSKTTASFSALTLSPDVEDGDIPAHSARLIGQVCEKKPLCHNMTNLVVQNFAANIALAV